MKIILALLLNIFFLLAPPLCAFVDPNFYSPEVQSSEGEFVRNQEDPHYYFAAHFADSYRERSTLMIHLNEKKDIITIYFYLLDKLPKTNTRMHLWILNQYGIKIDKFYLADICPESPLEELIEVEYSCEALRIYCERLGSCPKYYRITFEWE